jgi:hypothetical protein
MRVGKNKQQEHRSREGSRLKDPIKGPYNESLGFVLK